MEIIYFTLIGAVIGGLYGFIAYKRQQKNQNNDEE